MKKTTVNPFPMTTPLVAGILTQMSVGALTRVFGTYHLEVMEAMLKSDEGYRSKHLLRKINTAINLILDGKSSLKKCSSCKARKFDVKKRLDPYEEDVNNKKVYKNFCNACHKQVQDAI